MITTFSGAALRRETSDAGKFSELQYQRPSSAWRTWPDSATKARSSSAGAGLPREERPVGPADVDTELRRVRRDHAEDPAVPQPPLDRPPLGRQIPAAVATHPRARPEVLAERLAEGRQHDLHRGPAATEHDGLATGAEEWQRPAVGDRHRGPACAGSAVGQRRLDEEDVALPARRTVAVDEDRRSTRPG